MTIIRVVFLSLLYASSLHSTIIVMGHEGINYQEAQCDATFCERLLNETRGKFPCSAELDADRTLPETRLGSQDC